jgi:UDP-N-acetylmuramoylalanine--D-glutamate ligase
MISNIKKILEGKSILLLGFGREGQSTYNLLKNLLPDAPLAVADQDEQLTCKHPGLEKGTIAIHTGSDYLRYCSDYDLVIKTPGIPYHLVKKGCKTEKITSQTDLFMQAYWQQVIGVTGTKGKSTTATLIHHLLKMAGQKSVLSGNIGIPPFDMIQDIEHDTWIVFEMSSHQLEHISIAPHVAVLLNIFPEHLDHYEDFTAYRMAKFNIHHMQKDGSLLIYNADDPYILDLVSQNKSDISLLAFSASPSGNTHAYLKEDNAVIRIEEEERVFIPGKHSDLPGKHNRMNLMAALLVCINKGLETKALAKGINTYRRLEHRLEYAGTYNGIKFYNDSIATIPEACIQALKTIGHVDLLILGGYDRKLDYSILYEYLEIAAIPNIVFMGEAGRRMYDELKKKGGLSSKQFLSDDMKQTFDIIKLELSLGDVCLLSPAAASYGMFSDFEERGRVYKKMAADLEQLP